MATIKVLEARSLKSTDPNGLSDPYCLIGVANPQTGEFVDKKACVRSETKRWTLTPSWKKGVFEQTKRPSVVRVEIWDKDEDKEDDFVGFTLVKLDHVQSTEDKWFTLSAPKETKVKEILGDIHVVIEIHNAQVPAANPPAAAASKPTPTPTPAATTPTPAVVPKPTPTPTPVVTTPTPAAITPTPVVSSKPASTPAVTTPTPAATTPTPAVSKPAAVTTPTPAAPSKPAPTPAATTPAPAVVSKPTPTPAATPTPAVVSKPPVSIAKLPSTTPAKPSIPPPTTSSSLTVDLGKRQKQIELADKYAKTAAKLHANGYPMESLEYYNLASSLYSQLYGVLDKRTVAAEAIALRLMMEVSFGFSMA